MTRRLTVILFVLIFSLSGCKATGNWSFKRDGDGFSYVCEPFEGYSHCGTAFDLDSFKAFTELMEKWWRHVEHLFRGCAGCPPDGRTIPLPAVDDPADSSAGP